MGGEDASSGLRDVYFVYAQPFPHSFKVVGMVHARAFVMAYMLHACAELCSCWRGHCHITALVSSLTYSLVALRCCHVLQLDITCAHLAAWRTLSLAKDLPTGRW